MEQDDKQDSQNLGEHYKIIGKVATVNAALSHRVNPKESSPKESSPKESSLLADDNINEILMSLHKMIVESHDELTRKIKEEAEEINERIDFLKDDLRETDSDAYDSKSTLEEKISNALNNSELIATEVLTLKEKLEALTKKIDDKNLPAVREIKLEL